VVWRLRTVASPEVLEPYAIETKVSSRPGRPGMSRLEGFRDVSEPWLSADVIAEHRGVTKDTVYSRITDRHMPAHKVGRLWKFQASEVGDWVRSGGAAVAEESPSSR
jgi:excisionase family DNA binding protein